MRALQLILAITSLITARAQYAPAAGQPGSTAMFKDSLAFVGWAKACTVSRGYVDMSAPGQGMASAGDSSMATGNALSNGVVSLGDGGSATCTFYYPIADGPGPDFAVFENGITDSFLELAYVEVSSDGLLFFRFPAHSLTDTLSQTSGFGSTDPGKINNLAGKYRSGFGTPFDLQEMAGLAGLNTGAITHVRVVDVVGSLNASYATRDSYGNKVNDPWPTPFPSSGFDLDAIGVIHENRISGLADHRAGTVSVFPNPASASGILFIRAPQMQQAELYNVNGSRLWQTRSASVSLGGLGPGIYTLIITTPAGMIVEKVIIL